jgi:hypothetical protein
MILMTVIVIEQRVFCGKALKIDMPQRLAGSTSTWIACGVPLSPLWIGCGAKSTHGKSTHYPHQPVRILNRFR